MKRRTVVAALIFVLALLAAGPGLQADEQTEKIKLKVYSLPDPKRTDPFSQAQLAVIEEFKRRNPEIELVSFSGIEIEGVTMDSKPLLAIAGGVSPDVIYVNFRQSDTYIQSNFLYPLDEFLDDVPKEKQDLRIAKPVWPVIKRKGPKGEEHVWAIPYATLIRVLVYRKDLFHKVGLDPERPPETWDEMLEYAKRLTIPEEGTYGMHLVAGQHAAWDWITYLWSAGGRAVEQQEDGTWRAVFNSEAGVDALDFYLKLISTKWRDAEGKEQEGFVIREGQTYKMWEEGKIGMRLNYLSAENLGRNLDPALIGVAPVPKGPTGLRGSELNCPMMGIFSGAGKSNNANMGDRDPEKVREAAWKYIWFFDSEDARKIRLEKMIEAGYGKMQNPLYLKRYGYEEYLKYTNKEWQQAFEDALKDGKPEPYGRNCQMVYQFMTYPLEKAIAMAGKDELGDTPEERRAKLKELLDWGVARTNQEMIGVLSADERAKRNRIALLVAMVVAVVFFATLYKVWKIFTPKEGPMVEGWMVRKYFFAYLLLLPGLASILLWKYGPMFWGSVMAFQDYRIVGDSEWVGLRNFADVLYDPVWWSALGRTLLYMFMFIGLAFWPPILLAILLQEVSHGKLLYRTIYYLPAVITGVIVIYLWKLLYDPSDAGGLNQILMALGFEKKKWLKDESLAMLCCVLPTVWAGMGPGCLIYLAALKGIPDDNYEAADIDGANFFQKIRHIVFPHLKALVLIQLIAAFIAASQQTGFILVMTFGGPNEVTKVAGLYIFEKAYLFLKFGTATTMAWMLGIMLMGFTIVQLRRLSRMEFKAAGRAT